MHVKVKDPVKFLPRAGAKSHREYFSLVCFLERALVLQDTEKSHSVYKCHCSMKTLPDFVILARRRQLLGYHSLWHIKMLFSLLFFLSLVKSLKCFWNYKSSLLSMHTFIRKYHKNIHIERHVNTINYYVPDNCSKWTYK